MWSHQDPVLVFLTIDGERVVTTPEHPFFTTQGAWVAAGNLQPGDEIRTAVWGTGTVQAITFTATPQTMYNFTVATAHTYFVGDGQWLVHNECGDVLPKLSSNARSTDNVNEIFKRLEDYHGIDPNVASERLHELKRMTGRGGNDNVLFDMTGNVYDPVTHEWIGSLTVGGGN